MKIVHVEDFFLPSTGYQLPLLAKYMANKGHDVVIVTSKMNQIPNYLASFFDCRNVAESDKNYYQDYGVQIIRMPIKGFVSGRAIFPTSIFSLIDSVEPDIVYVHGNDTLTGMRFALRSNKMNYPIVMDSHMLEMASVNKLSKLFRFFYRLFIAPIIIKRGITVIRTQNDNYIEKHLGIPLKNSPWISTGTDVMLFKPDASKRHSFRIEYDIAENDFVVIYAGKLDEQKGGMFLANALLKKFDNLKRNIVFIIIGNTIDKYGEEVEELFSQSGNRILRFPTQNYVDLARFYQASDLAIFPKQCSLSFYDVQAAGLPVLLEDNAVNLDRLKNHNGFNYEMGSIEDFRNKICEIVNMEDADLTTISKNSLEFIHNNYNYDAITDKYIDLLKSRI